MVMEIFPLKCVDLKWNEPLPDIVVNAGTDVMISSYLFQADGHHYPTTDVSDL
jgi:hypothetical protein